MKLTAILTAAAILASTIFVAQAGEQRRFYDARGRSIGTAATDSQGSTTFRDNRGRTTGTLSGGVMRDERGRTIGRTR
jgi:hypothetical protein